MEDFLPTNLSVLLPLGIAAFLALLLAGLTKVPYSYNIRNLLVRWKTTLVTALAFTLVITLLVVMLAFVNGMSRMTANTGQPGNIIVLAEGATDEVFSRLPGNFNPRELPSYIQNQIQTNTAGEHLVSQEVYVIVNQKIANPNPSGPFRRFVQMRGIRDIGISTAVHNMELLTGDWFSPRGVRTVNIATDDGTRQDTAYEIVLGEGVARIIGEDIFGRPLQPGDVVEIGPRRWVVTGVMRSEGSTFGSEVWARDTIIGETFGRQNSYSSYVARTASEPIARAAAQLLKKEKIGGISFQAYTEREYYSNLDRTNKQFSYAIYFVAIIMAIGGVLGVMNTMFAAISQRSRDIGVLRLLGYGRMEILISFLLESLVIAILGGILGCAVGSLADGWTASSIISGGQGGGKSIVLKLIVDGNIIAISLLFTMAMGLLGGFVPALSAMRLRPLESLR